MSKDEENINVKKTDTTSTGLVNKNDVVVDNLLGLARVAQPSITPDGNTKTSNKQALNPEVRFKYLCKMCSYLDKKDMKLLNKAYKFADKYHEGQFRKSGEKFIAHPIEVAIILSDLHMDIESLCAALLHDTVEDTEATSNIVKEEFSEDIASLVEGVTKITRIEVGSITESQAQTLRKMFVAMSQDIRVIVIKLADRLHNMRTLDALKEDRRIYKAHETLEIFAPIAHRLGIDSIKWELEDLSFYYLEPNKYKQIARMVIESRAEREKYLKEVIDILQKEMQKIKITGHIMGRPKHLYSVYSKMTKKGKDFSEIYDLIAVRIIVSDIKECYSALGTVHSLWHPIPGRFKDYIAMPKFNMYQSLHTSVIGPAGRPLEVQIRTEDMHKTSEYGVAAHWRYKERGTKSDAVFDQQLAWLREMVDWQDETKDSQEMLKTLKVDLVQNEVFVFTPEGEVKSLHVGSTPVDFAYAVHTEVGHHCVGAKVNGSIVPLTYKLKTGDRVEILTQKSARPSRDWINFVKTPSARSKVRSYFSKISRNDDMQTGHDLLVAEMRKNGIGLSTVQATKAAKQLSKKMNLKNSDELYIQIGNGKESAKGIANKLIKIISKEKDPASSSVIDNLINSTGKMPKMITNVKRVPQKKEHNHSGIVVKGLDNALVKLSKCCNPVPGDDIIGFITRGRGITVHRTNCPNAMDLKNHSERIIDVSWAKDLNNKSKYKLELVIEANDRMSLLSEITTKLSSMNINLLSCSANADKNDKTQIKFLIQVTDINMVDNIINEVRKIKDVYNVFRVSAGKK